MKKAPALECPICGKPLALAVRVALLEGVEVPVGVACEKRVRQAGPEGLLVGGQRFFAKG